MLHNLIEKSDLPIKSKNDSFIDIIGKNLIYIENYIRIICFDSEKIIVKCKKYNLTIIGSNLYMSYYNNLEIKIVGVIHEISFV